MKQLIASILIASAVVLGTVSGAAASTGRDYGQHVAICAQTHGFTGEMNPGMHRGFAGWGGESCSG